MSNRKKRRSWSEDEKREICQQAVLPGASVAQVARRYSANANMIHNWLKDARFAPLSEIPSKVEDASFVELELTPADCPAVPESAVTPTAPLSASRVERIRRRTYKTRGQARQDIFDYIEMFYSPKRKHARNGMLSPIDFENRQRNVN